MSLFLLRSAPALLAIATALLLLLPDSAWARAGGGEGYHGGGGGGGGHGGGGGGGGGDGGFIIYLLIRLLFEHPAIGIPVVLIIVIFFIYAQNQGTSIYQSSVIRRGSEALAGYDRTNALATLRANDPAFDEAAFYQRVQNAFMKIQQAWCAQNLTQVRPFISDGVHERFLLQFAEQKEAGWRDHMENIQVQQIGLTQVESDGVYDVIAIRIAASAVDYRQSLATGQPIPGSQAPSSFVEVWSFVRRRGARTLAGKSGLIEGNCPNCGAAIEMNQSANCDHCKALLRSGEYDWVLAEITQDSEWDRTRHGNRPGMAELRERDPDFNAVELEDRASVMFWRKAAADRTGRVDPLRKIALPAYVQQYQQFFRSQQNGRIFFADCAVGSVRLLGVMAPEGEPMERAVVEVRWSGKQYVAPPTGGPPQPAGGESLFHTLFVLARAAGSKTDVGKGISSAHCPTCGAPEGNTASNACEYCGTVLNDGTHGWVLADILARNDPQSAKLLLALRQSAGAGGPIPLSSGPVPATAPVRLPIPNPLGMLAWMVNVAAADGQIDGDERQTLSTFAARQGIAPDYLDRMIAATAQGQMQAPLPADRTEAEAWLTEMANVAVADGTVQPNEYRLLSTIANTAGMQDADLKLLLNRAKADRYANTVRAMRQQKARGNGTA